MVICDLDGETIERVVLSLARFELDVREDLRALAPPRGPAEVEAALRLEAATRETLRAALVYNDYAAVRTPVASTLGRLGVEVREESPCWRALARAAARALIEVSDENARREQGRYAGTMLSRLDTAPHALPVDIRTLPPKPAEQGVALDARPPAPLRVDAPAQMEIVSAPARDPIESRAECFPSTARGGRSTAKAERDPGPARLSPAEQGDGPLLLDFAEEFIAEMIEEKGESWAVNSAGNHRSTFTLFAETHGNRPLGFYKREHLREFTAILRATPRDHHKGHGGAPIRELIEKTNAKDEADLAILEAQLESAGADRGTIETALAAKRIKRLRVATNYRHQQEIQRLFVSAADRGLAPVNLMKGVIWTGKQLEAYKREESDGKRLPWGEKAKALFGSRIYVEPLEDPFDPLFWAPLIAYLAGLREEEVLQLKTDDFETIDGIPCFRIQQGEGQHLKNENARRLVPVHPALISLGLLEMVERRRREGQAWLFPGLERSAARGRLSGLFTKVFMTYRLKEDLYDPLRPFHSLRHDCNVKMKREDVPLNRRKKILGHAVNDVTDVDYDSEGDPLHVLHESISKIRFDASGIRRPFAGSLESAAVGPRLRLVC